MGSLMIITVALMLGTIVIFRVFTNWGACWGATPAECARRMTGDDYLECGPAARVSMTRAVSLNQPSEVVLPWLAQIGRGAGWYSYDWLDNGGKTSAWHVVSWIPAPQRGDAAAIGYLRDLDPDRELAWWVSGDRFLGARARMVFNVRLSPENGGSRLVIRISADAAGHTARLALGLFQVIDTIMGRRQLLGIKERVENYGVRTTNPEYSENGLPDQYQSCVVIYASGQMAGARCREKISHWRQRAIIDRIIIGSKEEKSG